LRRQKGVEVALQPWFFVNAVKEFLNGKAKQLRTKCNNLQTRLTATG
jgi:hypothetical protein